MAKLIIVSGYAAVAPILSALSPVHTVFYRDIGINAERPYFFLKSGDVILIDTNTPVTIAALLADFPDAIALNSQQISAITAI